MSSLEALMNDSKASKIRDDIRQHLMASPQLENYVERFIPIYQQSPSSAKGRWAAQALLHLAGGKNIGIEARESSRKSIDSTWSVNNEYKHTLMEAAFWTKIPYLNDHISLMLSSPDAGLKQRASGAAKRLGIQAPGADKTPKIATLNPEDAVAQILNHKKGNPVLGEAVFARATCNACHTVSADEPPKGPYLGSIANILRPQDLAEALIIPNKAIAQGFKTNIILDLDGRLVSGFVTEESSDQVVLRDQEGKEFTFKKDEIDSRKESKLSSMPENILEKNTLYDLASLISYLEHVSQESEAANN